MVGPRGVVRAAMHGPSQRRATTDEQDQFIVQPEGLRVVERPRLERFVNEKVAVVRPYSLGQRDHDLDPSARAGSIAGELQLGGGLRRIGLGVRGGWFHHGVRFRPAWAKRHGLGA